MEGPKDSVYENGTFKLNIKIGTDYPMQAPTGINKLNKISNLWDLSISSQC